MSKRNHIYLTILLLFLLLLSSCGKQEDQNGMINSETEVIPEQESWNSEITLTSSGKRIALVRSGHMAQFDKKKLILLDDKIEIDFYDSEENHTSLLTAEFGEINERTKNLKATGNVVVVSDSGETLYTEELFWNNKEQKIISKVDVMITTGTDTLYGIGFESDMGLDNWTIKEPKGRTSRLVEIDE
ncbi:MAG: LPS export ABC transporter periplasmic protein LptC [Candidatus Marinimicrobia bacterium]|nr:LPS export ABC transporter periplasmic protein LptC [Candidatus Neomarinimicrobiota bacterium]